MPTQKGFRPADAKGRFRGASTHGASPNEASPTFGTMASCPRHWKPQSETKPSTSGRPDPNPTAPQQPTLPASKASLRHLACWRGNAGTAVQMRLDCVGLPGGHHAALQGPRGGAVARGGRGRGGEEGVRGGRPGWAPVTHTVALGGRGRPRQGSAQNSAWLRSLASPPAPPPLSLRRWDGRCRMPPGLGDWADGRRRVRLRSVLVG